MIQGTHTEFFTSESGKVIGILSGVPDRCKHDDKETAYILGNGDVLLRKDHLCPTDEATMEYIQNIAEERNTWLSECTGACSKCGKVLSLREIMGDAYWI